MKSKISIFALVASAILLTGCSSSKVDELDARVTKLEAQVAQNNANSANQILELKSSTDKTNSRLNRLRDSLRDD